jgi:hypothetical protein
MAQHFILQMLVALFAEDIDLLPKYFVTQILEDCTTPASSYDLIGDLFEAMNTNCPARIRSKTPTPRSTPPSSPPTASIPNAIYSPNFSH